MLVGARCFTGRTGSRCALRLTPRPATRQRGSDDRTADQPARPPAAQKKNKRWMNVAAHATTTSAARMRSRRSEPSSTTDDSK
jgi:hypothetical protein